LVTASNTENEQNFVSETFAQRMMMMIDDKRRRFCRKYRNSYEKWYNL